MEIKKISKVIDYKLANEKVTLENLAEVMHDILAYCDKNNYKFIQILPQEGLVLMENRQEDIVSNISGRVASKLSKEIDKEFSVEITGHMRKYGINHQFLVEAKNSVEAIKKSMDMHKGTDIIEIKCELYEY